MSRDGLLGALALAAVILGGGALWYQLDREIGRIDAELNSVEAWVEKHGPTDHGGGGGFE